METHSLRLGGHSSREHALYRIKSWCKNAKSFSIARISRRWYGVHNKHRNVFDLEIIYFSRKNEGKYQIPVDECRNFHGCNQRREFWGRKRAELVKNY